MDSKDNIEEPEDKDSHMEGQGEAESILPKIMCGYCRKYHTSECIAESIDSLRGGKYFQNEDSEPVDPKCFELDFRKLKPGDLIELFTENCLKQYTLKHFVKGGSSLGLYKWENGRYVDCEEEIKAYVEELGLKCGLKGKVKTHIVNEVIEKLKRRTYFKLQEEEEPKRIAFKNVVLDWEYFLNERVKGLDKCIIPIEETKDKPVFHLIPWDLDVELLRKCIQNYDPNEGGIRKAAEDLAPEVVKIFRDWVGDNWILLFEIIGFCLYPDYPFHKAFMLVGEGSNGKSTYLQLIKTILGGENTVGISLQDICLYRFAASELYHKLANLFPDLPSEPLRYTGWFKILTGEDYASAPRKFKSPITFKNYAKLIFSANQLPEVTDMSYAFWRRWIIVEFPNKFEENPDFFKNNFTEEAIRKIVALSIIAFTNVWLNGGFTVEGEAADFKETWLRRVNSIYAYVKSGMEEGRIKLDKNEYTETEELYSDYRSWCEGEDRTPEEKATFTKELERLFGIRKTRIRELGKRIYVYQGIKLLRSYEEGPETEEEQMKLRELDKYFETP